MKEGGGGIFLSFFLDGRASIFDPRGRTSLPRWVGGRRREEYYKMRGRRRGRGSPLVHTQRGNAAFASDLALLLSTAAVASSGGGGGKEGRERGRKGRRRKRLVAKKVGEEEEERGNVKWA